MIYKGNTEISPAPYREAAGKERLLIQATNELTSYEIPALTTSIKPYCFYMYGGLQNVYIPYTVTDIYAHAFDMATVLQEINLPEGLEKIHDYAFNNCVSLSDLVFPSTLKQIFPGAFKGCTGITSFNLPSGLIQLDTGAFEDCTGITSITLPSTVAGVKGMLFKGCTSLVTVNIPQGQYITEVGEQAFYGCSALKNVNIPEGVTYLGSYSFNGCSSLENITLPSTLTEIRSNAFQGAGLKTINIPEGVTKIDNYAFWHCESLTSAVVPSTVTNTTGFIFTDCANLESVEYKAQIVGQQCFNGCLKLKNVSIPNATQLQQNCFERTCFEYLEIPATVTTIAREAFKQISVPTSTTIVFKGNMPNSLGSSSSSVFTFSGNGVVNYVIKGTGGPSTDSNLSRYKKLGEPATIQMHIYVPASLVNSYKSASNWSAYWNNIEADPETV